MEPNVGAGDRLIKLATTNSYRSFIGPSSSSSAHSQSFIERRFCSVLVTSFNIQSPPPSPSPIPVLIVQAITTRQSNQSPNNNQTTTTPPNHHHHHHPATSSSQFKATTTNSSKLIAYEYIVDQGKNFTSGCPVTDSRMVSFWFRTDTETGARTISWDHQVRICRGGG